MLISQTSRKNLIALVTVIALVALAFWWWWAGQRAYPYGVRTAALPIVVNALGVYASEHKQQFPDVDSDPYRSLEALYPNYLSARYLAGLSADPHKAELALGQGGHLGTQNCSYVYFPGLSRSDDPELAIIWEERSGITFNGRAWPGRAVGLVDGTWRQIPDREWSAFVSKQTRLREAAFRGRTNAQPPHTPLP